MKVFISWSGNRSRAVAELLSDWTQCVIQAAKPWISTRHIDRGALWFSEISDQLKNTQVGIICLTHENKDKPWILFEAGALAKGLSSNRVCTFLIELKPSDIEDPLAQFNHTMPDKDGLLNLVKTLNTSLGEKGLDERILNMSFETYWPQFEAKYKQAVKDNPLGEKPETRTEKNLLSEIVDNTRYVSNKMSQLEARMDAFQQLSQGQRGVNLIEESKKLPLKYFKLTGQSLANESTAMKLSDLVKDFKYKE